MDYGNHNWRKLFWALPQTAQDFATSIYGYKQNRRVFGKFYGKYFELIKRAQFLGQNEIRKYQEKQVVSFVQMAAKEVPYYQNIFNKLGIIPEDLKRLSDFNQLPLLDKETVSQHAYNLISRSFRKNGRDVVNVHTSGTTGKGLNLFISKMAWQREYAFRYLHLSWAGINPKSRMAFLAGHPVTAADRTSPPYWANDRYNRHIYFSSQHISSKTLPDYIKKLADFEPELIRGYPSSLYLLAIGVIENRRKLRPKAVFTNSESLMDYQREIIEDAFRCKVYNWYGNTEQVANIVECEKGNLHVKEDHSFVEFLTHDGRYAKPGETAEMICTGFGNYAMPLIRYKVGDMAILSERTCSCGRAGRIVERIVGRVEDIIVTPDGMHVGRLDHIFKNMVNVKEAQIFQRDVNSIELRIVKRPEFGKKDIRLIMQDARVRLGNKIKIKLSFRDRISRESSGKLRFVISEVPPEIILQKMVKYD